MLPVDALHCCRQILVKEPGSGSDLRQIPTLPVESALDRVLPLKLLARPVAVQLTRVDANCQPVR